MNEPTTQPESPASTGSARSLAQDIARELFTSGDGMRAERLRFVLQDGREWGGWSEPSAASHIEKIIGRHTAPKSPNAPTQQILINHD